MKKLNLISLILLFGSSLFAQIVKPEASEVWEPEPKIVIPGTSAHDAPSDAIILMDGTSADAWQHGDGSAVKWEVKDGIMTVQKGTGPIFTKQNFGD